MAGEAPSPQIHQSPTPNPPIINPPSRNFNQNPPPIISIPTPMDGAILLAHPTSGNGFVEGLTPIQEQLLNTNSGLDPHPPQIIAENQRSSNLIHVGGTETEKTEIYKSWSSLLKNNPISAGNEEMEFVPPVFVDGVLQIDDEILDEGIIEWQHRVVGFFLDFKISMTVLRNFVETRWKLRGNVEIGFDRDIYYFDFSDKEDRSRVLEGGSFNISGKFFSIRPWSPEVEQERANIKTLPLWVKFNRLPKQIWNRKGLSRIASTFGKPLFMDKATESRSMLSYARVCIEVNATKELPETIKTKVSKTSSAEVYVEYAWKPSICIGCQVFGHDTSKCRPSQTIIQGNQTSNKADFQQNGGKGVQNNKVDNNVNNFQQVNRYKNKARQQNWVERHASTNRSMMNRKDTKGESSTYGAFGESSTATGNPTTNDELPEIIVEVEEGEIITEVANGNTNNDDMTINVNAEQNVVGTIENESALDTSTHIEPQQPSIQPDMPTLSTPSPGTATTSPIITEPPSTTIETPAPPLQPPIPLPPTTHISKGESEAVRIRKRWEERQKQHAKEIEEELARKGKESTKAGKQKGKGKQEKSRSAKLSIMEDVEENVSKDEIEDGDLLKNYLMKGI